MKKLIFIALFLIVGVINAQLTSKTSNDVTSHGSGNATGWHQEFVFVDSGATYVGAFSASETPVGIGITRDIVYDSTLAGGGGYLADGYHYDSTWTASDFAFLYGFNRVMNDSARTTLTKTDTLDFLPVYDNDGNRLIVQADSMSYIALPQLEHVGAKYFYVEFIDTTASPDTLVSQKEPRTLIFFYEEK